MSIYTIKRSFGQAGFEVSGPDKEWVEAKAEIFAGQLEVVPAKKSPKRPATASPKANIKTESKVKNLLKEKLDSDSIDQLIKYVSERQAAFDKTFPNQAAIIAKFLKDNLAVDGIDPDDLTYLYKQVGEWGTVNHLKQLENATIRKKYFTREGGKFLLSYAGEKFAQDKAKDEAK